MGNRPGVAEGPAAPTFAACPSPTRPGTTSSSSAAESPAPRRPCCWPAPATTSSSSTASLPERHHVDALDRRGAASCSCRAGGCSTTCWPPVPRRSARCLHARRGAGDPCVPSRTGPGSTGVRAAAVRAGRDVLATRRSARRQLLTARRSPACSVTRAGGSPESSRRAAAGRARLIHAAWSSAPTACGRGWPSLGSAPTHQRRRTRRAARPLHLRRRRRRGTAWSSTSADGAFAGVFPTNGGEACVWLIRPTRAGPLLTAGARPHGRLARALDATVPDLARRVRAGRVTAPLRGTVGLPNHVRRATGPGWALVGDAGYHRDPITSHGITDAFRDAELLATRRTTRATSGGRAWRVQDRAHLADTFRLTRELGGVPHPARFAELQIELEPRPGRRGGRPGRPPKKKKKKKGPPFTLPIHDRSTIMNFIADAHGPTEHVEHMYATDLKVQGYVANQTRLWAHSPESMAALEPTPSAWPSRPAGARRPAAGAAGHHDRRRHGRRLLRARVRLQARERRWPRDRRLERSTGDDTEPRRRRPRTGAVDAPGRRDPSGTVTEDIDELRSAGFDDRAGHGHHPLRRPAPGVLDRQRRARRRTGRRLLERVPDAVREAVTYGRTGANKSRLTA